MDFGLPPSSVICSPSFASATNDTVGWEIKIRGHQMPVLPSKWTLLFYYLLRFFELFETIYIVVVSRTLSNICDRHFLQKWLITKTGTRGVLQKKAVLKKFRHIDWKTTTQCFIVNIAKFLRTPILMDSCERMLVAASQKSQRLKISLWLHWSLLFFLRSNFASLVSTTFSQSMQC